jgi:hypothetical protein
LTEKIRQFRPPQLNHLPDPFANGFEGLLAAVATGIL